MTSDLKLARFKKYFQKQENIISFQIKKRISSLCDFISKNIYFLTYLVTSDLPCGIQTLVVCGISSVAQA